MSDAPEITVLDGRVRLLQPQDGFRTSIDAVLLAAACPAKADDSIIDLGCGVGTAGLCVLERLPETKLTGIDIQEDHIELARKNAKLNNCEAEFITANICDYIQSSSQRMLGSIDRLGALRKIDSGMRRNDGSFTFKHVICNPPYLEDGTHSKSTRAPRAKALGHDETTLDDWITASFNLIRGQGSLTLIHRADHIDKIINLLTPRFGAIEIIPLWPKEGIPAKRVIIRARKHSKSPAKIHTGIILHDKDGEYTKTATDILRNVEAID